MWTALESLGLGSEQNVSLTVTGGLPFFGGPGNNYSLHAIAQVVRLLRDHRENKSALVAANGGYLSKHSIGIYSTTLEEAWKINAASSVHNPDNNAVSVIEKASGTALIESYAAVYKKAKEETGFIVGTLNESGERFLAMPCAKNPRALAMLFDGEPIGREISVQFDETGLNFFSPK